MVETYSAKANRNMRRPVVKEEVVAFMRQHQKAESGFLADLEDFAQRENIPIIPKETAAYFRLLLKLVAPSNILEVGTAIGYSALLLATYAPQAQITTIDRNPEMLALAQANFDRYDSRRQIKLLSGDAQELLSEIEGSYDLVFMDSAKSKYIVFLPDILRLMPVGGVVLIDDVFQGGDVAKPFEAIARGQRAIYRGLKRLFDATLDHPGLTASLLPLGDGLLMIRKDQETIDLAN
ncbi:O-methyltransferase [Streptococcus sp. DD12]|uniref:O-methyltransferase n=1 Tax=Streptococcus sp. DD12 TaxID=1777880 RepID=UPI0007929A15|nr:O-methyltransferase [Streptococcus sp. DD12]KXT76208.1 O-methyltransferase family protein (C1) [Streptococcus sp. DD12]